MRFRLPATAPDPAHLTRGAIEILLHRAQIARRPRQPLVPHGEPAGEKLNARRGGDDAFHDTPQLTDLASSALSTSGGADWADRVDGIATSMKTEITYARMSMLLS
jgi:hypothetical protein